MKNSPDIRGCFCSLKGTAMKISIDSRIHTEWWEFAGGRGNPREIREEELPWERQTPVSADNTALACESSRLLEEKLGATFCALIGEVNIRFRPPKSGETEESVVIEVRITLNHPLTGERLEINGSRGYTGGLLGSHKEPILGFFGSSAETISNHLVRDIKETLSEKVATWKSTVDGWKSAIDQL